MRPQPCLTDHRSNGCVSDLGAAGRGAGQLALAGAPSAGRRRRARRTRGPARVAGRQMTKIVPWHHDASAVTATWQGGALDMPLVEAEELPHRGAGNDLRRRALAQPAL